MFVGIADVCAVADVCGIAYDNEPDVCVLAHVC